MSNERNADSVLFKLDTLTAMQAQNSKDRSEGGGAPEAMARLAAPAPQNDAGSGLIDLSTLGGVPGPTEQAADASSAGSDLTSSAALSQSSLLSSSGMSPVVPTPHAVPSRGAPAPSRTPLLILSVLALLALVAAVTAIVLRG